MLCQDQTSLEGPAGWSGNGQPGRGLVAALPPGRMLHGPVAGVQESAVPAVF